MYCIKRLRIPSAQLRIFHCHDFESGRSYFVQNSTDVSILNCIGLNHGKSSICAHYSKILRKNTFYSKTHNI